MRVGRSLVAGQEGDPSLTNCGEVRSGSPSCPYACVVRRRSLFTQGLVVNAVLLGAIGVVAGAVAGVTVGEVVAIVALAVVVGAAVNMILLRRRFAPLEDLIQQMEKVDLSRPGSLLPTAIDG